MGVYWVFTGRFWGDLLSARQKLGKGTRCFFAMFRPISSNYSINKIDASKQHSENGNKNTKYTPSCSFKNLNSASCLRCLSRSSAAISSGERFRRSFSFSCHAVAVPQASMTSSTERAMLFHGGASSTCTDPIAPKMPTIILIFHPILATVCCFVLRCQ